MGQVAQPDAYEIRPSRSVSNPKLAEPASAPYPSSSESPPGRSRSHVRDRRRRGPPVPGRGRQTTQARLPRGEGGGHAGADEGPAGRERRDGEDRPAARRGG